MNSLARIQAIRKLQEKAAEQELIVARFFEQAAVDRLRALDSRHSKICQTLSMDLGAGKSEQVYLCCVEDGLLQAMRPAMEREIRDARVLSERMEAVRLGARIDHASVLEIARVQKVRKQKSIDRLAQALADEVHQARKPGPSVRKARAAEIAIVEVTDAKNSL